MTDRLIELYWDGSAQSNTSVFPISKLRRVDEGPLTSASMQSGSFDRDEWLSRARQRLDEIAKLPAGWDGYGAPRIQDLTREFAARLLYGVWAEARPLPFPAITPMSNGSIMIEWASASHELTAEVRGVNSVHVIFENARTGDVKEFPTRSDFKPISEALEECSRLQAVA